MAEKLKLLDVLPVVEIVVADQKAAWVKELIASERFVISEFIHAADSSNDLLLAYIKELSNQELLQILRPFEAREFEHRLHLTQTTLRHLEIFSNYRGDVSGSLYHAINRTKTSSGARQLRSWMSFPLRNKKQIEQRYDQIHEFREHMLELKKVRETLAMMGDVERRLGKISQPPCHGRDLTALAAAVQAGLVSLKWCASFFKISEPDILIRADHLAAKIQSRISDEAPLSTKQGHVIKKGFSTELDELIDLSTNAHALVASMELREKESTGISSLKIRFNNVFGYYIEITNVHKEKAPAHYQRKQTLANAERYCTEELIELEKKVLSAQVKRFELEFLLFDELRREVLSEAACLLNLASVCSELDVISSLAWLSLEESYCRPQITLQRNLQLEGSRHPVVEQFARGKFIANTIHLNHQECLLITGPNMAGKSTLMRQAALIVLLAQIGSYVPASSASLPVYDAIFTRIGASDQLSEGLSTFMVEMTETAQMLKSATSESLLILDEVGRGTATFDGMCLAQAILEHILKTLGNHVFFATHYHELTLLAKSFSQIKNAHMKVIDHKDGHIEFLHVLTAGSAGQSYGVKVAELAGLPLEITARASNLLLKLEATKVDTKPQINQQQMTLFDQQDAKRNEILIQELMKFPIQKSSPLQALNQIAQWQEKLN